MKSHKIFNIPILSICLLFSSFIMFQGCKPDDCDDEDDSGGSGIVVYKPNIYLYPQEKIILDVTLDFPLGGEIVTSIPEYGNGWNISVDTNGIIDDEFEYLFYESKQPNVWQLEEGWSIKRENLAEFFKNNLIEYGFSNREIDDFLKYWIPLFQLSDYYCIYPQEKTLIDSVIKLNISVEPDNVLRLFYLVKESNKDISEQLNSVKIEEFLRKGFYVTEWGVIL